MPKPIAGDTSGASGQQTTHAELRSTITLEYIADQNVWLAHSADIQGLNVVATTLTQMGERLEKAVALLLRLNNASLE